MLPWLDANLRCSADPNQSKDAEAEAKIDSDDDIYDSPTPTPISTGIMEVDGWVCCGSEVCGRKLWFQAFRHIIGISQHVIGASKIHEFFESAKIDLESDESAATDSESKNVEFDSFDSGLVQRIRKIRLWISASEAALGPDGIFNTFNNQIGWAYLLRLWQYNVPLGGESGYGHDDVYFEKGRRKNERVCVGGEGVSPISQLCRASGSWYLEAHSLLGNIHYFYYILLKTITG